MTSGSTNNGVQTKTATHPNEGVLSLNKELLTEYWELTKPRLSFLSVITAVVGYLAANPSRDISTLISLLIGTSLAAGSAGTLNQWMEREADKRMVRTRNRPIPSGAVSANQALAYGLFLGLVGIGILWMGTNPLAALLTLSTIFSYVAIYTPLKQVTHWCTLVGSIPGALPPLIGWAAASETIAPLGWVLFGILFCWQIPHFMAIAWTYKDDYKQGNFVMSTVVDPTGKNAAFQSLIYAALLLIISLVPMFLHNTTSYLYEIAALLTGLYFFKSAISFWRAKEKDKPARKLFFASIFYLPLILAALVVDRWLF